MSAIRSTASPRAAAPTDADAAIEPTILEALRRYWGFDGLRPLQGEAIRAGMEHRDSLVVMPTGGGKSLCYQVPPIVAERLDVVVSPLISLMKDQVDGLRAAGYPAAAIHSHLAAAEKREIFSGLNAGEYRLLFVSPERLANLDFQQMLRRLDIRAFAIDEAHCISHWGHDFRPEYRRLAQLKEAFPQASVHAFTATATPRVQRDIVEQLGLDDANVLVGSFDRPNLTYRILPRLDLTAQVIEVVHRHANEAVIVYCISRKDTEHLAEVLRLNGINASAYHAGLEPDERRQTQEAFAAEELDVVVATVAFGMGIDRSNVRCVIHAAMPKTIEHFQQETGRAGRDGLEAECVLFYSAQDVIRWKGLIERSAAEADDPEAATGPQLELLNHMSGLCSTLGCRHRALVRYFGQAYPHESCGACDVCLGEVEGMADSTVTAQKILSCVARTGQRFGVGHVVQVLRGADTDAVRRWQHDELSTHGLLRELPERVLRNLVYQLVDQGLLDRADGKLPTLALNEESWAVMRGEREVQFVDPQVGEAKRTRAAVESWEGVDRRLFDRLRDRRREVAQERGVPPYVIFGDATLRELAAARPTTLAAMRRVRGVGEKKLADLGRTILDVIRAYCTEHDVETDIDPSATQGAGAAVVRPEPKRRPNPAREKAERMFSDGASLDDVCHAIGRARSTVSGYLAAWIESEQPDAINAWVSDAAYARIAGAMRDDDGLALRPIFERLDGEIDYDTIRLVVAHRRAQADERS